MTPNTSNQVLHLEYKSYRRRFQRPLVTAHGEWAEREGVVLRLESPEGQVGYGELAPVAWFGDQTQIDLAELEALGGKFRRVQLLDVCCSYLRWALECALSQIADPALPGVRVPVAGLLPAGEAALTALPQQLASARRSLKWKIAVLPVEEEIALAEQIVAALPKGVRLRLDANGGLDERSYGLWLDWCEQHRDVIDYLEQPLEAGNEKAMFAQAENTGMSIAMDESIAGLDSMVAEADRFPEAVLIVKPSLLGSRTKYLRWRSANNNRRVVYSSCFETAIGLKAVWELAALDWPPLAPAGLDTVSAIEDDGLCPIRVGWELTQSDWPQNVEELVWSRL